MDYSWTSSPAVMTLTFDSMSLLTPQCFDITIIDDILIELEEMFTVSLSLQSNPRGQISLQTSSAPISITDNDGKFIPYSGKIWRIRNREKRLYKLNIRNFNFGNNWLSRRLRHLCAHSGYIARETSSEAVPSRLRGVQTLVEVLQWKTESSSNSDDPAYAAAVTPRNTVVCHVPTNFPAVFLSEITSRRAGNVL